MKIKAQNREIEVMSVVSTTINKNGKKYPALEVEFPSAVSEDDIADLTSGKITISKNTHEGYNTLGKVSVVIGKITTAEEERDAIEAEHAEMKESVNLILPVLDDKTALSVKSLYPEWEISKAYNNGERIVFDNALYKIIQDHTSQADWTPDVTPALYTEICESHTGMEDDPIPYDGNMVLFEGLYYVQDGVLYHCTRDSGTAVYHALADLVGQYVEVV